jgi:NAD(P)H-quinone oxidoreductase subunit 5
MTTLRTAEVLAVVGLGLPLGLTGLLGAVSLLRKRWPEGATRFLAVTAILASLGAFVTAWVLLGGDRATVPVGEWFGVEHAGFQVGLLLDPLSLAFSSATLAITLVVVNFSSKYLHREPGFQRFFFLLAMFVSGMLLVVLAASVEALAAGWELMGLASALLVGFFHERAAPVHAALHVFTVYRIGDAAMLSAALLVHHALGGGTLLTASGEIAEGLGDGEATAIGLLLVVAAAGKCAQLPFSGWLPRAMEGPTASSAVFYGALSIHAGAYLMLRVAPLLEASPLMRGVLAALGLATAFYATLVGRVQTDIKTSLSYASLTQIGIILAEIAFGLTTLAVIHMLGHACLRLLEFLRSPSLLLDFQDLRDAMGGSPPPPGAHLRRIVPPAAERWLYRLALERGYLDGLLDRYVVSPLLRLLARLDRLERRWCTWVAGRSRDGGGHG